MLLVRFSKARDVRLPAVLLTNTAKEIASITDVKPNIEKMREIAEKFPKDGIIEIVKVEPNTKPPTQTVLWQVPPEPAPKNSPDPPKT